MPPPTIPPMPMATAPHRPMPSFDLEPRLCVTGAFSPAFRPVATRYRNCTHCNFAGCATFPRIAHLVRTHLDRRTRKKLETYRALAAAARELTLTRGLDAVTVDEIDDAAERAGIHPRLLAALVAAESAFDPWAVSRAGASGLTQLMPAAAADHDVADVFDPGQNLRGGAEHLRAMLDRFGSLPLALAAYNAGAATVERYGGVPPFRETHQYLRAVLESYCRAGG